MKGESGTRRWLEARQAHRRRCEQQGFEAALAGASEETNPYRGKGWSKWLREAWHRGWRAGRRQAAESSQDNLF